jgi:hypothetical protein
VGEAFVEDRVVVPFVAGQADLELLQTVSAFAAPSIEDHVAAVESGGQALAEAGIRVDLVPVWAPLFLVWCDEQGVNPAAADAFQHWSERQGLVSVAYTHYEFGPVTPLIELEEVRSWAVRSILADRSRHSERGVASVWAAASAFLEIVGNRAVAGSELDVAVPTWTTPAHWHLDGSCCDDSSPTLDHVHAALMEGLAIDGAAVLIEPAGFRSSQVRVWELSPSGIRPLSADEARTRCEPKPGARLVDAWGDPARR